MAFVQKQLVPISLQGGLSQKTDAFQVQQPSLLGLENACFSKTGQLNKRFGYDVLPRTVLGGGTIQSAAAIDTFNEELTLFDNTAIYTYLPSVQSWANRGPAISVINSNSQIIRSSTAQQLNPDSATLNGLSLYAWEDSRGTVRYSVLDNATNAYCVADRIVPASVERPKVVVFQGLFVVFFKNANNLYYCTVNPSNPTVLTQPVNLFADGYEGFSYDATVNAAGDRLYIVYLGTEVVSGSIELTFLRADFSLPITSLIDSGSNAIDTGPSALSVATDSMMQVWVAWATGSRVRAAAYLEVSTGGHGISGIFDPITVDTCSTPTLTGIESTTPGILQLTYEVVSDELNLTDLPLEQVRTCTLDTNAVVLPIGTLRSVGLASKAFRYGANIFVQLAFQSTLQSTYFTAFLTSAPFTIVAKVSAQVGGGFRTNNMLPAVSALSPGVFQWPNLVKGQFISEDNTSFSLLGVNTTKLDFTNVDRFNSVVQCNNLLFVGGILQSYDGISVAEQNFHVFPEGINAQILPLSGALSAGQYQYQVVYAFADRFGQVQYSTPSAPITVSLPSPNAAVRLYIPTLRLTAKQGVVIKVYRTQVNQTTFQETTSELAPLKNDPTLDYVSFTDTAADINIAANQAIYTTGGVLPNAAPPSCSLITLFQDRVMLSGLEDPNLIWFSKNKVNATNFNTIPVEFSALNTLAITQTDGPITALALMDDALIIFKENSIYTLSGSGPNDTGGDSPFPPAELITNSIGCNNPNSVKFMKDGVVFQSSKGIWLLPRGLGAPQYIGAGVDDLGKTYAVSSVVSDPNDNIIIFTTFNGPALVYDYFCMQWSTWTNHTAIDAVAFNNLFTFAKANGSVFIQNRNAFTDDTSPIVMSITLPWLSFAGLQGYQSMFSAILLGNFRGKHSLNIAVGYDQNPAFTQFATIDATTLAGSNQWGSDGYYGDSTPWGGAFESYQFQVNFKTQRCASLRMRVSDNPTSQYTDTYTLNNITFVVGTTAIGKLLPAINKVGTQ